MSRRARATAAAGAAAAACALVALAAVMVTAPRASLLQGSAWPMLSYASGPISAGPASAHIDFGEPDAGAYLKDRAERGRDASIAMESPSSTHTPGYHGGVNRWREGRATPYGTAFPTYAGTSEQDARPVAWGYDQGTGYLGGLGWGPNYSGEGKEGAPRALGAAEKRYFNKAADAYDSALDHLYDAQVSAAGADWVASHGFYPGLGECELANFSCPAHVRAGAVLALALACALVCVCVCVCV